MNDRQITAIKAVAANHGARAFPVWDASGQICEFAIWHAGEAVGSVRLGHKGRLEAWSSLGDQWFKARDMEHAVALAIQGTHFRTFREGRTLLGGLKGSEGIPQPSAPLDAA